MPDGFANELFPEDPGATYGEILPLKRSADGSLAPAWPGFVHGVVNSAYNALTAPGETLTGKAPMGQSLAAVPDPLRAANDITGTMLGLGVGSPVPAGASRVFGGLSAKTADMPAFSKAIDLTQQGSSPTEVWNQTGWFKDVDRGWKFEIPDAGARLNSKSVALPGLPSGGVVMIQPGDKLGDLLHHPELYAAYPEMQNVKMGTVQGATGAYNPANNTLRLGTTDPEKALSTTLHEVQHGIQAKEGFASGGSPDEFLPFGPKQWNEDWGKQVAQVKDIRAEAKDNGLDVKTIENHLGKFVMGQELGDAEEKAIGELSRNHPELATKWVDTLTDMSILHGQHQAAFNAYSNLAGEVEARNVQERFAQGLGKETPPWMTQGYPTGQQTVRAFAPVDHAPFSFSYQPIDHNPFQHSATPVNHDPFQKE